MKTSVERWIRRAGMLPNRLAALAKDPAVKALAEKERKKARADLGSLAAQAVVEYKAACLAAANVWAGRRCSHVRFVKRHRDVTPLRH
jgi:hypothetical protein